MEEEEKLTKREKKRLAKEKKRNQRTRDQRISKFKNWIIGLLVIGIIGFGGFKLVKWINTPTTETVEPAVVTKDDQIKGNPDASLTLIEYSDFQCPACASYAPVVKQLNEEFPENLRIVYRHFPLTSIHKSAIDAAKAAEAAGKQGKFWEMHDKLFERQEDWAEDGNLKGKFEEYAKELELDEEAFKNDYESGEIKDKINEHIFAGNRLGINSTPTFILGDQKIQNPHGFEAFRQLIEDQLGAGSE